MATKNKSEADGVPWSSSVLRCTDDDDDNDVVFTFFTYTVGVLQRSLSLGRDTVAGLIGPLVAVSLGTELVVRPDDGRLGFVAGNDVGNVGGGACHGDSEDD